MRLNQQIANPKRRTERRARRVRTSAPFFSDGLARSDSHVISSNIAIDPTRDEKDEVSEKVRLVSRQTV
jgi:hypothetical protein